MLNKLNQPKGSTIGVLRDGRTVQEAIDELEKIKTRNVDPERFRETLTSSDDEVFEKLFAWLATQSDVVGTSSSSYITALPRMIELGGRTYTLTKRHVLDGNFGIQNGTILMSGEGEIIMGLDAGTKTRRHFLKYVHFEYIGASDRSTSLVTMARCFNSVVLFCNFIAGGDTARNRAPRTRYGLFAGSTRCWGFQLIGGEYYGGDCALRVGRANDHTGLTIRPGTVHHSRVINMMLCNPAGAEVSGCNIEHADNGAIGLGITSGTNTSGNAAHGVRINGVYFYNNGNGSSGSNVAPANILIGKDIPGTEGWDRPGELITSSRNTAHSITVSECYIVSPNTQNAWQVNALYGVSFLDNKVGLKGDATIHGVYDGTCANCWAVGNRDQGGKVFQFSSTATNAILTTRKGKWTPKIIGEGTAGNTTLSASGGAYSLDNGMVTVSCFAVVDTKDPNMAGNLNIKLPVACEDQQRGGTGISLTNIPDVPSPNGSIIVIGDTARIMLGSARLQPANVTTGTAIHFSVSYPADVKV